MIPENIVRSEYSYRVSGDENSTYIERNIRVRGDEELVRRTAESMEANLR